MLERMKVRLLPVAPLVLSLVFASCADKEPGRKPVGPQSENSRLSWTGQVTNPIQGQFGMMPQNQYRR